MEAQMIFSVPSVKFIVIIVILGLLINWFRATLLLLEVTIFMFFHGFSYLINFICGCGC